MQSNDGRNSPSNPHPLTLYSLDRNLGDIHIRLPPYPASPKVATTGSVTLAHFAVQVALQYEIDAWEIPSDYPTGYIPQGATGMKPSEAFQYPPELYGTEVFEVNENLRQLAFDFAKTA